MDKIDLKKDVYYQKEYISLYLSEGESVFEFQYNEGEKQFYQITIKRPIKKIGNITLSEVHYDLETAYGYGGYICNTNDFEFIETAWIEYVRKCRSENVIAEFIRYHPLNNIHQFLNHDFLLADRKIIYVDLLLSKEERWRSYSSKVRNILRKCNKNLHFKKSDNIDSFISLYEDTMKKNKADDFYFFNKDYFKKLFDINTFELYEVIDKENNILSTAFFNFSGDYAHYHLSANNYTINNQNSNYFILDEAIDIARAKGNKKFLLGGGRSPDDEDSLLKFKKKFSSNNVDFHIGGNIFDYEIYNKLISIWEKQNPQAKVNYFLKYRL